MDSSHIHQALTELGFTKKAAVTYVALLQLQLANAHRIAKAANVERTTVYDILEDLVRRGLATKSVQGKRQTYLAEPVERLVELVERQRTTVAEILPQLSALTGKAGRTPIVRFYDTIDGARQAVMDTIRGKEKIRRDFASVESIVNFLGKRFIDRQVEERVRKEVHVRSLRSPEVGGMAQKDWYLRPGTEKLLREVRYLPRRMGFTPVIFIHDDTVTVISSKEESYALVVQSKELAEALKVLFDSAWEMAARKRNKAA